MPYARTSTPSRNRSPLQLLPLQVLQRLQIYPLQQPFRVRTPHRIAPSLTSGQIQVGLTSFSRTIDDYDSMAKREIIAAKQEKAFQYHPTPGCSVLTFQTSQRFPSRSTFPSQQIRVPKTSPFRSRPDSKSK